MSQADSYETHFTYYFRVSSEEMNLASPGNLDYPAQPTLESPFLLLHFAFLSPHLPVPWLTSHNKLYAVQTLVSGFALGQVRMNLT